MCHRHKHGNSSRTKRTPEYLSWDCMIQRCMNPNSSAYKNYGARGIWVTPDWFSFSNFLKDMGNKPKGFVLDRIDNNKSYYKENCRWISRKVNNGNTRRNKIITYKCVSLCIAQWAERLGIHKRTMHTRFSTLDD